MLLDLSDLAEYQGALLRADFGMFCEAALAPLGFKPAAHHRELIRRLQRVAEGKTRRLMVCMPPGAAKSVYVSQFFPAWFLSRRSRLTIIAASHTSDLAEDNSRKTQANVRDMAEVLGYGLASESLSGWRTTNGGEYKPAGVGGPITGRRARLAIIDDPVKGADSVATEAARNKTWDWFLTTMRTRMIPGAALVVVMTRWHEDDLGGRLLSRQGDLWEVMSLPAQAGKDDPLGRAPGEFLWGDVAYGEGLHSYADDLREAKAESERNGSMRVWEALYQQNPRPLEGSLFKVANIKRIEQIPAGITQVCRAWDLASTAQSGRNDPDFTAGVKLGRTKDGSYVVLDVLRDRGGPDDVENWIVNSAKSDGQAVRVGLPQDPGQAGKTQVLYLTRKLAGHRVESSPETGDKETRAGPIASQCNVGNLIVVTHDSQGNKLGWVEPFLDELAGFPNGSKDDQVDALSRAFSMVGLGRQPFVFSKADSAIR